MFSQPVKSTASISLLITGLLFLNNVCSDEIAFSTPVLNVTEDYMEVSISNPFNLICSGLDLLMWDFEVSIGDIIRGVARMDFPRQTVSRKAGKFLFESVHTLARDYADFVHTVSYSCDFINTSDEASASLCISVRGTQGQLMTDTNRCSSKVEVDLDETLELFCYVNILAKTDVQWYHNKKLLPISRISQKLVIDKVDGQHSGLYECTAERSKLVRSTSVTIIRATSTSESSVSKEKNLNDKTEILCLADGHPLPKTTWYSSGSPDWGISEETLYQHLEDKIANVFNIFTQSVMNESTYFYQCKAEGKTGIWTVSGNSTTLSEISGVYIYKTNMESPTVKADINKQLELYCYAGGDPQPYVTWFLGDKLLDDYKNGVKFRNNSMNIRISHPTEGNSGVYECRAQNRVGVVSLRSSVTVSLCSSVTVKGGGDSKKPALPMFCAILILSALLSAYLR